MYRAAGGLWGLGEDSKGSFSSIAAVDSLEGIVTGSIVGSTVGIAVGVKRAFEGLESDISECRTG